MSKRRAVNYSFVFLLIMALVLILTIPMRAMAKGSYYSTELCTPDRSKKGSQSFRETVNTSHIFVNLFIERSFPRDDGSDKTYYTPYDFEGQTYYFQEPEGLYGQLENLNDKNLTITVQLMLRYDPNKKRLYEPSARYDDTHQYYAPNMSEEAVIKEYRAYMEYLSDKYSRINSHVDAWVCGNEVNAPYAWCFFGTDFMAKSGDTWVVTNQDLLVDHYTKFYDIVYNAVKSKNENARVCICVDHCWNESGGGRIIPTKNFLDMFAAREGNEKDWCIAFHCYPADLNQTRIWASPYNGKHEYAQFVDGYNLEVLTGYVKSHFGAQHRILLTEQGMSKACGDDNQAACLVYTYYKAKFDDMIDVFHIMKFNGCGYELNEPAATIWAYLDDGNAEHEQWIFDQVKGTIGVSSWTEIVPNWKSEAECKREREQYWEEHKFIFNGIDYSPVFDFDYYCEHNPDIVRMYTSDPVKYPVTFQMMFSYFTKYGMDRGQDSSPEFKLENYKNEHPELVAQYGSNNREYYTYYCLHIGEVREAKIRQFLSRFYFEILGRTEDKKGIDYWTAELTSGRKTGAEVALGFVDSNEFKTNFYPDDIFLEKMYSAFFDRDPDKEGFTYWSDKLIDGYTREQIVAGFTGSDAFNGLCREYGIKAGNLGIELEYPLGKPSKLEFGPRDNIDEAKVEAYVARLYDKALDRKEVAKWEIDYWKTAIMTGKEPNSGQENVYDPASVIATGFLNSEEYLNRKRTDEEFLTDLYASFFGREPDPEGYNYWLVKMDKGYSRRRIILEGFGTSEEFKALLREYGFVIVE